MKQLVRAKVVPSIPFVALNFGEMRMPPIGNPFPIPFAIEITSGMMPALWNAKKLPVRPTEET